MMKKLHTQIFLMAALFVTAPTFCPSVPGAPKVTLRKTIELVRGILPALPKPAVAHDALRRSLSAPSLPPILTTIKQLLSKK